MGLIEDAIEAIAEVRRYTGEDPDAVLANVLNGTRLMADEWDAARPGTEGEVIEFYRASRTQIYGMVGYDYLNPSRHLLSRRITEQCRGRVLDFGAGVGDNLIRLWQRGLRDLTHVDFDGYTRRFATQRYQARGMAVQLVTPDALSGQFDSIICLDVVEHATDPVAMLSRLAAHLSGNGRLFLNVHFGHEANHPMHFDCPTGFDELAYLHTLGVERTRIFTARDLLLDVRDEAERPLSLSEVEQLTRGCLGRFDLSVWAALWHTPIGEVAHA